MQAHPPPHYQREATVNTSDSTPDPVAGCTLFVGIDWAEDKHDFCAISSQGRTVKRGTVTHSAEGLAKLATSILDANNGDPTTVAIAIETPRGPVVDGCQPYGFRLFSINPKQLDRFRDRFSLAGSKNDQLDALVLADSLRTDAHLFTPIVQNHPTLVRLQGLNRIRQRLSGQFRQLANQLRDVLVHSFPALLKLCNAADEPFLWDLLERAPAPDQAARLRHSTLGSILQNHRIRRHTVDQLADACKAPALPITDAARGVAIEQISYLLPQLRLVHNQLRHCENQIEAATNAITGDRPQQDQTRDSQASPDHSDDQLLALRRDARIIRSCVGIGPTILSVLLAEVAPLIQARDLRALRARAGVAPVTRKSGRYRGVRMRYACNQHVRHALHAWARVAIRCDPPTREHYANLKARGHNHNRAVRGIMDRLLSVLVAMLKSQTTYEPTRRHAYLPQSP